MPRFRGGSEPQGDPLALRYLSGGLATYLPGETLGPRLSRDYELVWIIQGRVTYHLPEVEYEAPPGAIVLSRPGFLERYTWDARRHTRHAYFHFALDTRPFDWPEESAWPVCRVMPAGDALRPLFRHVVDHWCYAGEKSRGRPTPEVTRWVATMMDLFIRDLEARAGAPARRYSEGVQRALAFIQNTLLSEPDRALTLLDLAKAAGTSPQHLCRLFAAGPGLGPMHAVRLLRLDQAAALLARTPLSVKQIAARCGFASQFHFSRSFRETFGASPSEVRAASLAGAPPPVARQVLELPDFGRW